MEITLNSQIHDVPQGSSVWDLAKGLNLPDRGVAIAVNNKMVSMGNWKSTILNEFDNVLVIKAACGG